MKKWAQLALDQQLPQLSASECQEGDRPPADAEMFFKETATFLLLW